MSKTISGLYKGTLGLRQDWNTSIVWQHVFPTQGNYGGTDLPRSFNVETPQGLLLWTHNNATKHMHEAILSLKDNPKLKFSNPKLYTQFILYEYWRALESSVKDGIVYDRKIQSGNWEFVFSKARSQGKFPVVKHAKFSGI